MPIPAPNFSPPFTIVRCSHVDLTVRDLAASRAFYEATIGMNVTAMTDDALYLRGMEERNHHSIVCRRGPEPACNRLGFKVASEDDLDRAAAWFDGQGTSYNWAEMPFQGRTLHVEDPRGMPLEFYFKMDRAERILQQYGHYHAVRPMRIDHFNCFSDDVAASTDFYNALGFRITEYTATDGPDEQLWATWMHRKGTVHDIAFTNGRGPRLHHVALWAPTAADIIHLCDLMATTGYLANMERGPGRHGISNSFFLYVRDPDGHRVEIYVSDYLTVDPDLEPIRWSLTDTQRQTLWGTPAPKSWFEEGTVFPGVAVREPALTAQPIVAH